MKKYNITLTVTMNGEVTVYADSLEAAKEMALQKAEKGLANWKLSKPTITETNELPCTRREVEKQKIIEQLLEHIDSEEFDREYYLEAMKRGLITRLPKEMR